MDIAAILATGVTTGIISVPLAAYLGKIWVEHQLGKDQSVWDAKIRKGVETYLADQAAQRAYDWEARKRLYEAIGPLRFQLLLACRDMYGRVWSHGKREDYSTSISGYYGQSTLYRILRPITLGLLIERKMAYADFAVDPAAVALIRFNFLYRACLSGEFLVKDHSRVNWDYQVEHVFSQSLDVAGESLVVEPKDQPARVMRFDEYEAKMASQAFVDRLDPFPDLLKGFTPSTKPLFWLRLVAAANLCRKYVGDHGQALNISAPPIDVAALLGVTSDPEIRKDLDKYVQRCAELPDIPY
jgi:hypothetical protein